MHSENDVMDTTQGTDAAILSRLIRIDADDLSREAAQSLLGLHFDREDLDRFHDLVSRNQDDALNPAERSELESYLRISTFLDLMHARARRSLKKLA
jgi:hypothetical protein